MTNQKQWEKIVEKFFKHFDEITNDANKHGMNGELCVVALETYMTHVLTNNCVHTLQKTINNCYEKSIDFQINNLKSHKKYKVGRAN
jgi:uncharacterized protein YejL (UPF0352 family)